MFSIKLIDFKPTRKSSNTLIAEEILQFYNKQTSIHADEFIALSIKQWIIEHKKTEQQILKLLQLQGVSPKYSCILGFCFEFGIGLQRRNPASAFQFYQHAAANNDGFALVQLGKFYRLGRSVPFSRLKAVELYQKSAALGHPQGALKFSRYISKPKVIFHYHQKAAEKGLKKAQCEMIKWCLVGETTLRDKHTSLRWLLRISRNNYQEEINLPKFMRMVFKNKKPRG
ncbi:3987_t:CDS:1 [Ambispora leptoticha]|uniref:3987_t:CDS:1 n=1 Tax=Ambispora leptoticha TaxID=144679 RepID=A0A9N9A482_9GLOM|nr:3987_t:CDS:1 [Ambispora leptoticha]